MTRKHQKHAISWPEGRAGIKDCLHLHSAKEIFELMYILYLERHAVEIIHRIDFIIKILYVEIIPRIWGIYYCGFHIDD